MNNNIVVPEQGPWPLGHYAAGEPDLGRGQRTYSASHILDFASLVRIIQHWRWLILGALAIIKKNF